MEKLRAQAERQPANGPLGFPLTAAQEIVKRLLNPIRHYRNGTTPSPSICEVILAALLSGSALRASRAKAWHRPPRFTPSPVPAPPLSCHRAGPIACSAPPPEPASAAPTAWPRRLQLAKSGVDVSPASIAGRRAAAHMNAELEVLYPRRGISVWYCDTTPLSSTPPPQCGQRAGKGMLIRWSMRGGTGRRQQRS